MAGGRRLTKMVILGHRAEIAELFECRLAHDFPYGSTLDIDAPDARFKEAQQQITSIGFSDHFFLYFQ
jgi:hypothetical protein